MVMLSMLKRVTLFTIVFFTVTSVVSAGMETQVSYEVEDIGASRWQFTYEVSNASLTEGISAFSIWFDLAEYANLAITSPAELGPDWDQLVLQPNSQLLDNGLFDVLAIGDSIDVGQSISGFAVAFTWTGDGAPGNQLYEILNPDTFQVLDSGFTVPEPTSLLVLGVLGLCGLVRRR